MGDTHSIRIPVHGFVEFDDWERDIINHPVFQRLRRIRQLAFSDHLYPGSTHSRFEHSLGVMHIATRLFDTIENKCAHILEDRLNYNQRESNARRLVRLAALLHDVGHAPFSHTGESLMPHKDGPESKKFVHEDYTAQLIQHEMKDVIDDHSENKNSYNLTGKDVADFVLGKSTLDGGRLFWRELVVGQLDADRMDYLLRDAYHCGVTYGHYDLDRIIDTITVVEDRRDDFPEGLRIGIEDGGRHAAEGLILARYFMFRQVYFHPVRKAYDNHAYKALQLFLNAGKGNGLLPNPSSKQSRKKYLKLDDWKVMDFINSEKAGRHSDAILRHRHDRCVVKTREVANAIEIAQHEKNLKRLLESDIEATSIDADKEWYKVNKSEIRIANNDSTLSAPSQSKPLSEVSNVVQKIEGSKQLLILVPIDQVKNANDILQKGE